MKEVALFGFRKMENEQQSDAKDITVKLSVVIQNSVPLHALKLSPRETWFFLWKLKRQLPPR
jgi:hypothetical protein